jgi:hypothetical protein
VKEEINGDIFVEKVIGRVKMRHLIRVEREQGRDSLIPDMQEVGEILHSIYDDDVHKQLFFT